MTESATAPKAWPRLDLGTHPVLEDPARELRERAEDEQLDRVTTWDRRVVGAGEGSSHRDDGDPKDDEGPTDLKPSRVAKIKTYALLMADTPRATIPYL